MVCFVFCKRLLGSFGLFLVILCCFTLVYCFVCNLLRFFCVFSGIWVRFFLALLGFPSFARLGDWSVLALLKSLLFFFA